MRQNMILLVEDEPEDCNLTKLALKKSGVSCELDVVNDGAELLDYLFRSGEYANRDTAREPCVVLLDLKTPRLNGLQCLQVLQRTRGNDRKLLPPIVVLSSSDHDEDMFEAYRLGASGYVCKPVDFEQFVEIIGQTARFWVEVNQPPPRLQATPWQVST
jgi:two-component system response regulator